MKKLTLLFFLIFSCYINAQEAKTKLLGTVLSNTKRLANVHIINLNSKRGTITNENGEFEMYAHLNDTLFISSIQYDKVKIAVSANMISSKKIFIVTQSKTYQLSEVIVKNHALTESMYHDILNKPTDSLPEINVSASDFKNLDFSTTEFKNDANSGNKPPDVEHLVNPILMGAGAGVALPNYQLIAEHKLRKRLQQQKDFPKHIVSELGLTYFTKELQIPKDKIHHFLSYCAYKNIVNKYTQNKLLEVIKILQEEAKTYNAIKKED